MTLMPVRVCNPEEAAGGLGDEHDPQDGVGHDEFAGGFAVSQRRGTLELASRAVVHPCAFSPVPKCFILILMDGSWEHVL